MVIKGVYIEEKCFNYNFCFSKWVCFGLFKYKFCTGTNSFCQFSREEEGNRIITEDTLSPQIIPEKFVSKVLDEESLLRLQEELQAETIYDCTYSTEGKEYEIPKLDSYDKSFLVFLQTEDKGWNLKKETL